MRAGAVAEVNALPEFRKTNRALSPLRANMGEGEGGTDDGFVSWESEFVFKEGNGIRVGRVEDNGRCRLVGQVCESRLEYLM